MCGIALIVSGVQIEVGNLVSEFVSPIPLPPKQELLSIDDIKIALHRRGPDSIESKKVLICAKKSLTSVREEENITPFIHEVDHAQIDGDDVVLHIDGDSCGVTEDFSYGVLGELYFIGATLQLRGTYPISQPLVDASGNILVYNGEIFGGVHISCDSNDGESLMQLLGQCCSCRSIDHGPSCSGQNGHDSVPQLLSRIKGPWALIYWQNSSKILWFGRDAFGRRSLLVHWPMPGDSRLVLSTVSPISPKLVRSDIGEEQGENKLGFWEELSCGVYSMSIGDAKKDAYLSAEVKRHPWTDVNLEKLIQWKRTHVQPMPANLRGCDTRSEECVHSADTDDTHSELGLNNVAFLLPPQRVLVALKEAVFRRTALYRIYKSPELDYGIEGYAPVAVLFSGGLDSMILAALLDQCLDPKYEIDLLNVSFDGPCAPDRITARAGLKELVKIAPSRRWNLVEINADLQSLTSETSHVMSLIAPAKTYMDLNIGVALWLAARGDGWLYQEHCQDFPLVKFKSKAKILLVGSGADEQCAGYGRHRTKYRLGSWLALNEEMQLDMQRIWKRNLGRDDRCIADNGKEARFPFLDEDVIRTMLDIPLWEIADLDQPSGIGDKKILRKVAQMLGLSGAAVLPKRAIQFGSRIARESNRKNFGSNRAANQASAGSVEILHRPSFFSVD